MTGRSALNQPETNTGEARIDHPADPLFPQRSTLTIIIISQLSPVLIQRLDCVSKHLVVTQSQSTKPLSSMHTVLICHNYQITQLRSYSIATTT